MFNILYASSKTGVDMLIISLNSVCKHIQEPLSFYILCCNWDDEFKRKFVKRLRYKVDIFYINIPDETFTNIRNTVGLPLATLYRLCGIEMLPLYVHQILYLDIDILCVSDEINKLFIYFNNKPFVIAAVPDSGIPDNYQKKVLESSVCDYFNAGVLYVNVDYCREIKLWDRSSKILRNNEYVAVDQDILNFIFMNKYTPISHRFNYMSPQVFKDLLFYRKKNLLKAFDPILIHFDGPQKPWYKICANPFKALYIDEMKKSGISISSSLNRGLSYKMKLFFHYLRYKLFGI